MDVVTSAFWSAWDNAVLSDVEIRPVELVLGAVDIIG